MTPTFRPLVLLGAVIFLGLPALIAPLFILFSARRLLGVEKEAEVTQAPSHPRLLSSPSPRALAREREVQKWGV